MTLLGLLVVLGLTFSAWDTNISYYHDMFRFDNYSIAFSGLLIVFSLFLLLMGGSFYKEQKEQWSDYLSIFLFTLTGGIILTGYTNLTMLFLGIEILSISLYVLAASNKDDLSSNEAGMKYFLMGAFASGILLFGIALVYGATGTFYLHEISAAAVNANPMGQPLLVIGTVMMLVGMFFKVSAAPFHFWSPDVYQGSPTLVTAFMATVAKISAIAAFYRLIYGGLSPLMPHLEQVFMVVTVLTISMGNIIALVQQNVKRMLAFSGISHAGFMLLGIMSVSPSESGRLLYYALAYGSANLAAFAVAILVFKQTGNEGVEGFNGLIRKNRLLAVCLTIAMLSMASIPPFSGFWAKYFIFASAIAKGYLPITIIGVVNTLFGVFYYFRILSAMYLKPANDQPVKGNTLYTVVLILTTAIVIGAGILPNLILSLRLF